MKNLFIILIAILSFTSCKKEDFRPETPYVCQVSSVDIESNVYVNGRKQKLDSVVSKFYTDSATMTKLYYKVYFYSFRIKQGDVLNASVDSNSLVQGVTGNCLSVGQYFIGNFDSWQQLYFVSFFKTSAGVECYYDLYGYHSLSEISYQHTFN